jgi:hypothetical protein
MTAPDAVSKAPYQKIRGFCDYSQATAPPIA